MIIRPGKRKSQGKCETAASPVGHYRYSVTVQAHNGNVDSLGQPDWATAANWTTYCVRQFSIESTGGGEPFEGDQLRGEVNYTFKTRTDSLTKAITPKMRCTWDGRTFEILSAREIGEQHLEIELAVNEQRP